MTEPNFSINFTARTLAASTVSVGQALVFDSALGYWVVATAANRTAANARAQAIALTDYGGSAVGKVSYQSTGILSAEVADIGPGSASWVRVSATGGLERCTPSGSDDLVGYAYADGRIALAMGLLTPAIVNAAGVSPGGSNGQLQYNNAGAFGGLPVGTNGQVLGVSGGVNTYVDAVQVPAGTAGQVVVLGGSGDLAVATNGSNGDVLTMVAGVPAFSAPAASGAPTNASYVTIALNGSLSAERVLAATAPVTITDGGANANVTIAWTAPTGTGVMFTTAGAMNAAAKTTLDISTDVAVTYSGAASGGILVHNGTKYVNTAKGSNSTFLTTSSGGTVTWAQVTTAMLSPGSNGQFLGTQGGVAAWGNVASSASLGTTPATAGTLALPSAGTVKFRNNANGANLNALHTDTSDRLWVGSTSSGTEQFSSVIPAASASIDIAINGSFTAGFVAAGMTINGTLQVGGAVAGYSTLSAMWQWDTATVNNAAGTTTLTAAQYSKPYQKRTGSGGTVVWPAMNGGFAVVRNEGTSNSIEKVGAAGGTNIPTVSTQILVNNGSDMRPGAGSVAN